MPDARERLRDRLVGRILAAATGNQSSRRGAKVLASVVHTTESGPGSLQAIVRYFQTAGVEASASYVLGDQAAGANELGEEVVAVVAMVPETLKPWTQLSFNPHAVSYELVGRAARTRDEWLGRYRAQVRTLGALVADDVLQYELPIRHGVPGFVGHADLSAYGFPQTHRDPGAGFPWDVLEADVRRYVRIAAAPPRAATVRAPARGRPKGAPLRIPAWAWRLHEWQLSDDPAKGPRPAHPTPIPPWYYPWRAWKMGLAHAADR